MSVELKQEGVGALVRRQASNEFVLKVINSAIKTLVEKLAGRGKDITRTDSLRPDVRTNSRPDLIDNKKATKILSEEGKFTKLKKFTTDFIETSVKNPTIKKASSLVVDEILTNPDLIAQSEGFDRILTVEFDNTVLGMPPLMKAPPESDPAVRPRRPIETEEEAKVITTKQTPEAKEPEVKEREVKEPEVKQPEPEYLLIGVQDIPEYKKTVPLVEKILKQTHEGKTTLKNPLKVSKADIARVLMNVQGAFKPSVIPILRTLTEEKAGIPEVASAITVLTLVSSGSLGIVPPAVAQSVLTYLYNYAGESIYNYLVENNIIEEPAMYSKRKEDEQYEKEIEEEIKKQMEKEEKEKEKEQPKPQPQSKPQPQPQPSQEQPQPRKPPLVDPKIMGVLAGVTSAGLSTGSAQGAITAIVPAIVSAYGMNILLNSERVRGLTLQVLDRLGFEYNEELANNVKTYLPAVVSAYISSASSGKVQDIPFSGTIKEGGILEKKINIDEETLNKTTFNLEQKEEEKHRLWEPKKIMPTTAILDESRQELYADDLEYAAFDFVEPTSEGANGNIDTNPLKKQQFVNNEVRYNDSGVSIPFVTWAQVHNANKLTQEQLNKMFLGTPLPELRFVEQDNADTFENVQNVHLANAENLAIDMFSPYSDFSNVDNNWWTNPDSILYTINP